MAASGVAVNAAARVWSPFKDLQAVVESAIHRRQTDAVHDLEVMLKKHKTDFLSLLKNNPKNPTHREAVKKSNTVGLLIHGEQRKQTFPSDVIEEAIILSDLFDLNEFAALELLLAGEENRADFPGLTRGLVAVLLYYDGRRSLLNALRTLILSLEGRTFTLGLPPDLTHITNTFILNLVDENLTNKILNMYEEIEVTCAECLFSLSCQRPLGRTDTLQLINHLKGDNSITADGSLRPVTLALLMALLYCFDVSVLEREDAEDTTVGMPVFSDPAYIQDIHKELRDGSAWAVPGLRAVVQLAWGVTLRQLSQYPQAAGAGEYFEEDEAMIDLAIEGNVFSFLHKSVISVNKLHKEEFYLRRLHGITTDLIYHLPLKVKELRNRGDETARILLAHLQEGQEPPTSLRRDFEDMLYMLCVLYEKDPVDLDLALDYWCPPEPVSQHETFIYRPPQRQSDNCRVAMCENQHWSVVMLLFGLVSCAVPPTMKAELLRTLAALARTPEIAATLWQTLEASQILVTVSGGSGGSGAPRGGLGAELEEVEARGEEFAITRAFLSLLASLTDTPVPTALGAGLRPPGFDPYLAYIRDDVFLKFATRAYKSPAEKWEVAESCLRIMCKLLHEYEPVGEHFIDLLVEGPAGNVLANKPAGFNILLHLLKDSRLLQMVLRILDDSMKHFQTYTQAPGQENLEGCALLCLQLLARALDQEAGFVALVREIGSPLLVTPLDRLLLAINPRTGRADFIVTIT
ncbi:NU205-like protein, partial [Mya arenaria]